MTKLLLNYKDWAEKEHPIELDISITSAGIRVACDTHLILAQRRHTRDNSLRIYPHIDGETKANYISSSIPSVLGDECVWGDWVFELVEQQFSNPTTHMTSVYKCLREV